MRLATFFWVPFAYNAMLLPGMFWDYFVFSFLRTPSRLNLRVRYHPSQDKLARVLGMLCLLRETEIRKINEEEIVAWLAESDINGDIEAMERGHILENLDEVRWIVKDAKGSFHFGDSAMRCILINSVPPINWVVGYVLPFIYSFLPRARQSSKRADGKDRKRWERNENERTRKERKRKISKERTKAILGTGEAAALKRQLVWVRRAKRLVKKGAVTGVVVFLLVLTFAWNVNGIPKRKGFFPGSLRGVMWFTGLQQTWNMFSPNPPSINSWPVLEGKWSVGVVVWCGVQCCV